MNLMTLKKPSLILVHGWISLLLLKWVEKLMAYLPIKKSKQNLKNLNEQRNNTVRICNKCGETKPLTLDYYQPVKSFKYNFSYYCNDCNKPKPKE